MQEVKLELNEKGHGKFYIKDGGQQIGEMVAFVAETELTVYHTEVTPEREGEGLSKLLLGAMVAHARKNNLQVIPLCSFVQVQFKRHPEEYADVWKK